MNVDSSVFDCLLKAPSKDYINRLLLESFLHKDNSKVSQNVLKSISEQLDIQPDVSEKLLKELAAIVKLVVFEGYSELAQIQSLLSSFYIDVNLNKLLAKLILDKIPHFKKSIINENSKKKHHQKYLNTPFEMTGIVPKLVEFDWRVDIKTANNMSSSENSVSSTGEQTCILQMKNDQASDSLVKKRTNPQKINIDVESSSIKPPSKPVFNIDEILQQQFKNRSEKQLGLLSFLARVYPSDKCGSNGLPLTPNSIRIYGRFQRLKAIKHKHLCQYIDIQRGTSNPDRLFIISEHYSLNLNDLLNDTYLYNLIVSNSKESNILIKWFYQIVQGLAYISTHSIVHRYLHLRNICIEPNCNIKLNNFGLFYMSEGGFCVDFPIINIATMAPESLFLEYNYANKFSKCPANNTEQNIELSDPKSDVWSFGAILFQFLYGLSENVQANQLKLDHVLKIVIAFLSDPNSNGYSYMLALYQIDIRRQQYHEQKMPLFLLELMKTCLVLKSFNRPSFEKINALFYEYISSKHLSYKEEIIYKSDAKTNMKSDSLPMMTATDEFNKRNLDVTYNKEDHLWKRHVDEVYYLWNLAGGDCQATLFKNGKLLTKVMPLQKLSSYVRVETGQDYGKFFDNDSIFDDTILPLSLEQLRKRLSSLFREAFFPICNNNQNDQPQSTQSYLGSEFKQRYFSKMAHEKDLRKTGFTNDFIQTMQKQPLNIRESDTEYQFHRIVIFSRFLATLPYKKHDFYKECVMDIPPIYRALSWAALLDCDQIDLISKYEQINKEIVTQTDRQIDVDIPRCHQYDPLMASPSAHYKLKRVLKAWVLSQPNLVYWQGLDSLCAPFLYLNFNNEALAYGCLKNFVNKYAANFFLKDNSAVIQEYLAVFNHLIAFNDAELADHFEEIEFRPDLYAIPWFLTMFSHVFPLYKIFHLWDTLLLGSSAFPLCIGAAILHQLRLILLASDFNECILLFSELPEISIARCVTDAIEIYSNIPPSCLYRQYNQNNYETKTRVDSMEITDHIDDPNLDIIPTALNELRSQLCPRISTRDVLYFYEKERSKLLLIDLRDSFSYSKFYVLNSINVPFDKLNLERLEQSTDQMTSLSIESDINIFLIYTLKKNPNALKVIYSNQEAYTQAIELANRLVRMKFSKLCLIKKGIESFISTKIIYREI